jgi:hypothetical protein
MNGTELCGCCEGITQETPAAIENRPGLTQIAYRVGTWAQFKSSMLDALSNAPELAALRTRSDDDFTIALCDAFAIACDILTFYYERSANEHYLRTATQLVSVAELAALIGYEPPPGVAASAALAFTLDAPPPTLPQKTQPPQPALVPNEIDLATGTKVQSVPGPGQTPVTFETIAPIAARYAWNALSPRLTVPYVADAGNAFPSHLRLSGLIGTLTAGDYVLIVVTVSGAPQYGVNRVASLTQDTGTQTTLVTFEPVAGVTVNPVTQPDPARFGSSLSGPLDEATIEASVAGVTWIDQTDFVAQATKLQWDLDAAQAVINSIQAQTPATPPLAIFKLGVRASIFGHNAPSYATLPSYTLQTGQTFPSDWEGTTLDQLNPDASAAHIFLDATYPSLRAGDYIVLADLETFRIRFELFGSGGFGQGAASSFEIQKIAQVVATRTLSLAQFLLSSTVTEVTLDSQIAPSDLASFGMRTTAVLGSNEQYAPDQEFLDQTTIGGSLITLDSAQLALQLGQELIVTGVSATQTGQTRSELRTILALSLLDGRTQITLDKALDDVYVWNSVTINANVAPATHGESKSQILGSGDATQSYQRFAINQLPVTYVSAATPTTTASTLAVRVNGELWTEVPFLYGHGPTERVFTTQVDVNGNRYVEFGDGVENGARLPTGQNNVIATYRQGLGRAGNVNAAQLSTLLSRPLGLHSVINPLPASGGGDPQTLGDARATAPITVRALDRVVSLDDFGDFARSSAAVAKAEAVWAWDGHRRVVCITVSGPDGAAILPETPQYTNLLGAIQNAGDGTVPVALCSFIPRTFTVSATLTIDPALDPDAVTANAKTALQTAFGFDARDFMQPVYRSEVIETLQSVPGVVALTLDELRYNDRLILEFLILSASDGLIAGPPALVGGTLVGAELLTIDNGPLPNVVHA